MTRAELKDILEGAGFVAIIASLVFVGIETRNSAEQAKLNTQAVQISAYQDLMDNSAQLNALAVEDVEVGSLLYKGFRSSEALTDFEQFRFDRSLYLRFRHGDMAFFQFERGAIDESRLHSALQILNLSHPRVKEFWLRSKDNFVKPYRDYIDRLIAEETDD